MGISHDETLSLNQIANKIYQLESSGGKNDGYCESKGGHNGFGYRMNKHEMVCFDSTERVRGYVKDWFAEKLKVMTLAEAACVYNQGIKTNKCQYWQKFQEI